MSGKAFAIERIDGIYRLKEASKKQSESKDISRKDKTWYGKDDSNCLRERVSVTVLVGILILYPSMTVSADLETTE